MMALALAQASAAAAPQQPVYEATFRPLKKSEQRFRSLGPVGPYYPERAFRNRTSGEATLSCQVAGGGELENCKRVAETPVDSDFSVAARIMADRKRIFVADAVPEGATILVRVPFVLGAPASVEP
jgi:hypothetical protein